MRTILPVDAILFEHVTGTSINEIAVAFMLQLMNSESVPAMAP